MSALPVSATLSAAGAAVGTAARLEAMASAIDRARQGDGDFGDVLRERDGAISGLAELGRHFKCAGLDRDLSDIYSQLSVLAAALAGGTLGAHPAITSAGALRMLAVSLTNRVERNPN